jgi:hypothetical protein
MIMLLNYGEFEGREIIITSKNFDVRKHPSTFTHVAMHFHLIS